MSDKKIYVTKPYLPDLSEITPYLEKIWSARVLTNNGPYHQEFESKLADYLEVEYVSLFANATLALVTSMQALRLQGEVITTPYSFVATSHALLWNRLTPVFVDVNPITCNIDPDKIESAITPNTQAILAVHCYGNPCEIEKIQKIADTYGLRVIYDAAHAFGVRFEDKSLLLNGDFSILSFHATKVFNTFEGGALVCKDAQTKKRVDYLKNFGFADETTVMAAGINGKMSEFSSVLGIVQLNHVDKILAGRQRVAERYREQLDGIEGLSLMQSGQGVTENYSYFPIMIGPSFRVSRDELYDSLRSQDIIVRRYFYPLISEFPMYRGLASSDPGNLTIATRISRQVLCLPIYPDLSDSDIDRIVALIRG